MQPDYMKMAQGQAAPKQQEVQAVEGLESEEDIPKLQEAMDMPTGQSPEAIKERIMIALEQLNILKDLTPQVLQQVQARVDELVQLVIAEDVEGIKKHPITKLLQEASIAAGKEVEVPTEEAQAAPQQGPTDFAGMVKPPMGGGMSGR